MFLIDLIGAIIKIDKKNCKSNLIPNIGINGRGTVFNAILLVGIILL